ncbi:NUDIX hydrolase [Actinoallomurus rhizosphaericola]|uniref:NUDIX hydrolase n=1 Tax=Actinoallomurus rhizosphaericola TaxID=2952536 RepID=UPI002092514E|nr:CoA pyrophosphatase [Actinoallomurus rhizosphaericola]MCO5994954.1 CoA pyrophosphatase [Actinoallomurus rhizosphaericola]
MTVDSATDCPEWLRGFAAKAPRMPVPAPLRPPANGARAAAVLILFGEGPDGPDLLLLQRADTLRKHAGQPAFPGGGIDPGDGGPVGAALREAAEETGVDPSGVSVLATMPEMYIAHSGYRVTPVVGWWREPSAVDATDPGEVASVARVPLSELTDPANRLRVRAPSGHLGPAFRVRGMLVWGFTGGLLHAVLEAGGWDRPWDTTRIEDLPDEAVYLARGE